MARLIVVLLGMIAAGASAAAEPAPMTRCVLDRMVAGERLALGEVPFRGGVMSAEMRTSVENHGNICGRLLSVTEEQARQAGSELMVLLAVEASLSRLRQAGIDPALVDAWLDGQSDDVRLRFGVRQMSEAELDSTALSLIAALMAGGIAVGPPPSETVDRVMAYVVATTMRIRAERGPLPDPGR